MALRLRPQTVPLKGHALLLRELNPRDIRKLQSFFYSHTHDTIHSRYGYMIRDMTPERAKSLVCVDQTRDLALALTEKVRNRELIRGVGRYYLNADRVSAEIAVVVCEELRHLGLGSLLVQNMVSVANERGLSVLEAWVLLENYAMIALLKKLHFKSTTPPQGGMLQLLLKLPAGKTWTGKS